MVSQLPENPVPSLQSALAHKQIHVRQRAQIILMTLDGHTDDDIAQEVGVSKRTVNKWQNAWSQDGLWIFPSEVFTEQGAEEQPMTITDPTAEQKVDVSQDDHNGAEPPTPEPEAALALSPRLDMSFVEAIRLQPQDNMSLAVRKLLLHNMARLINWEPVAVEGIDPEGVHKMRVATRRIRSVLEVFVRYIETDQYKSVNKRIRRTAKLLGDVRDLDVFMETVYVYVENELAGDVAPLQPMLDTLNKPYQKARRQLIRWLDDQKYDDFVQAFVKELRTDKLDMVHDVQTFTVAHMVPRLVYSYLEYLRLHEPLLAEADYAMLHEARLDAKRFRYVLEFFTDVLGDEVTNVISAAKGLQDFLGEMNDLRIANDIAKSVQDDLSGDAKAAVKTFRSYCKDRATTLRGTVLERWASFDTPEMRAALGAAVGKL